MRLKQLVASKRIIICAGPGGVGKTTTAASLGVVAARAGRSTLVATIDPAPRLIDALALTDLGPRPAPLPPRVAAALAIADKDGGAGTLSAARIDARHAFDALVAEYLHDGDARTRILENTIYRQITTTLTGAQEYAATLALHGFARDPAYQLIVLDTPPTANAMEFFEAPARISAAIESPVIRWLLAERNRKTAKIISLKRLSSGGALMLRRLARIVGSRFLDDLAVFLADFEPVLEGFLARTQEIDRMLRAQDVAIVLVCAPEPPAIDEALAFAKRLDGVGLKPSAFIVNRMWPRPAVVEKGEIESRLGQLAPVVALGSADLHSAADTMSEAAQGLLHKAKSQERQVRRLHTAHPDFSITTVPVVETVDSLDTLRETAIHLTR